MSLNPNSTDIVRLDVMIRDSNSVFFICVGEFIITLSFRLSKKKLILSQFCRLTLKKNHVEYCRSSCDVNKQCFFCEKKKKTIFQHRISRKLRWGLLNLTSILIVKYVGEETTMRTLKVEWFDNGLSFQIIAFIPYQLTI
jgi:hypothetical protein